MKHLKYFENTEDIPKIGEYAICKEDTKIEDLSNFILNNIGEIIYRDEYLKALYVKYHNIPERLGNYFKYHNRTDCRMFSTIEIVFHSHSYKEVENFLNLYKNNIKYNL